MVWKFFTVKSSNQLLPIMGIASAKSRSTREVSHQPVFMGCCQTISHTCLSLLHFWYLVFFLFKKIERVYILSYDGIKTDNWLKLFELNSFWNKTISIGNVWNICKIKSGKLISAVGQIRNGSPTKSQKINKRGDYYLELKNIQQKPQLLKVLRLLKVTRYQEY